jgi:outer membrane receptor protein involved in Fe transport
MKVTVTRLEVEPEKLPQKIEVVDSLDLALTPAQDITDVLKKNASIDVVQYPGLLSGVGIRGFRPSFSGINQRTLTLIDGRPSGATNLASLQPYNVERIEVVKGPVSALYGPQAMGGVVNIVPKYSTGDINTQLRIGLGSYDTKELVAHSGGSIGKYLNFDFSGLVFDQGKDYRIGSEYSLGKLSESRYDGKATHILASGDSADVKDDIGAGTIRHYSKYDKHDFSLRLGAALLDERLTVDVRGEMFGADAVETPGDIAYGDGGGMKGFYRNDEEVVVKGDFGINKFKLLQYWAYESTEYFKDFAYGSTMYTSYASGTEWLGFQAKDDIYLPTGDFILKPVVTLGFDFNSAQAWSRRWQNADVEIAPYSPNSQQKDVGIYTQLFGDLKDGLATATVGLRFDVITAEILSSKFFPNNQEREESFNVFSPSYGLTFSPLKLVTEDYSLTLYHNLGKGFIPQSAGNIAGYSVSQPDTNGNVQVTRGNPELEPEENITVDGGIRAGIKALGIDAGIGLYRTTVENFVSMTNDNVPAGMTETYDGATYPVAAIMTYKNNDNLTTMAGLEWDLEWNILRLFERKEKLAIGTNGHAVLVSENITSTDTSEVFNVRNPNYTVSLTYDDVKQLSARLQTRFSGKQKDTDWSAPVYPYPDIIYPAFLVTDFSMRVKINEHHAVGGQVANITDENYYEKRGYNMPGRTFGLNYELSF